MTDEEVYDGVMVMRRKNVIEKKVAINFEMGRQLVLDWIQDKLKRTFRWLVLVYMTRWGLEGVIYLQGSIFNRDDFMEIYVFFLVEWTWQNNLKLFFRMPDCLCLWFKEKMYESLARKSKI